MSEPTDKSLYNRVKREIYKKMPKTSAYRSGLLVKTYKERFKKKYGNKKKPYKGKKTKDGLTRWYKEDWRTRDGSKTYKKKGDYLRPTKKVSKKTPATMSELSKKEKDKATKEKKTKGRVKNFKKK